MDTQKINTYYNVGDTTEVTKYANGASPYGVFDMSGNVQEWVHDQFAPYEDSDAPENLFKAKVPMLPQSKAEQRMSIAAFQETDLRYKVMRGGSWKSDPFSTAAYHRNFQWPQKTTDFYGFRCAADVES
jgi:iron(II)-dependent oxidoreductase